MAVRLLDTESYKQGLFMANICWCARNLWQKRWDDVSTCLLACSGWFHVHVTILYMEKVSFDRTLLPLNMWYPSIQCNICYRYVSRARGRLVTPCCKSIMWQSFHEFKRSQVETIPVVMMCPHFCPEFESLLDYELIRFWCIRCHFQGHQSEKKGHMRISRLWMISVTGLR